MKKVIMIVVIFLLRYNTSYGQITESEKYTKPWQLEFTSIYIFNSNNVYKYFLHQNNDAIKYGFLYGLNIPFFNSQDESGLAADIDFLGRAAYQIFDSFNISSEIGVTYRRVISNLSDKHNGLNIKFGFGFDYEFNESWDLILKTDQLFPNKKLQLSVLDLDIVGNLCISSSTYRPRKRFDKVKFFRFSFSEQKKCGQTFRHYVLNRM